MSAADENPLTTHPAYLRARDELAALVLAGKVGLDLADLTSEAMIRFNLTHQHAHELADQFLVDLKTDRRAHVQHDVD